MKIIEETGFTNITIQKDRRIFLPDEILLEYLTPEALKTFLSSEIGIFSITVYAEKPGISDDSSKKKKIKLSEITQETSCCTPGGGCC